MKWFLLVFVVTLQLVAASERSSYIVFTDNEMKPAAFVNHEEWYLSMVKQVSPGVSPGEAVMYSYKEIIHGFAATITEEESLELQRMEGCMGVVKDSVNNLHTTRTADYLGVSRLPSPVSNYVPQSVSSTLYNDTYNQSLHGGGEKGGTCDSGKDPPQSGGVSLPNGMAAMKDEPAEFDAVLASTSCISNTFVRRMFLRGYESLFGRVPSKIRSADDFDGHGTHVASIAVGCHRSNASLFGYAPGTATGMAPGSQLGVYKVCWPRGCAQSDQLAAFEASLRDGITVTLSASGPSENAQNLPYHSELFSIGSFRAVQRGMVVVTLSGNDGPTAGSVLNTAPWLITVGASSIDRRFPAKVLLGNNETLTGSTLYEGGSLPQQIPLYFAYQGDGVYCIPGSLDTVKVGGKIVVCLVGINEDAEEGLNNVAEKGLVVKQAGGKGMILCNTPQQGGIPVTVPHVVAAVTMGAVDGSTIIKYLNSTPQPTASIMFPHTTELKKSRSPVLAGFSSRGPNPVVTEILKPDLIAPGVDILANWIPTRSPSRLLSDKRRVAFNVQSGTSVASAHVAGIVLLIKTRRPDWSPAAVRSSLMTTADYKDHLNMPIMDTFTVNDATPLDMGSGHINVMRAMSPGLVYDMDTSDYVAFMCALNYTQQQIFRFTRDKVSSDCTRQPAGLTPLDLNYPSFSVAVDTSTPSRVTTRTVKNVGMAGSSYRVSIQSPKRVAVTVQPSTLNFANAGDAATYTVKFTNNAKKGFTGRHSFGRISWVCTTNCSPVHVVRSPIAITWKDNQMAF